jgi:hypothetical protein
MQLQETCDKMQTTISNFDIQNKYIEVLMARNKYLEQNAATATAIAIAAAATASADAATASAAAATASADADTASAATESRKVQLAIARFQAERDANEVCAKAKIDARKLKAGLTAKRNDVAKLAATEAKCNHKHEQNNLKIRLDSERKERKSKSDKESRRAIIDSRRTNFNSIPST